MQTGTPIDVRTGVANSIWQGDAIAYILRCLCHGSTPARPINIGLTEPANVRQVAHRFGESFGKAPVFTGTEQPTAWQNDCSEARRLFGPPVVGLEQMIRWNADWLQRGLPLHHKPTHYEERAEQF